MKKAIEDLENDHVHILRLTDIMEQVILKPEPNVRHLDIIVDLIRHYADGFHHAKEENLLFPKMVEKGFSLEQGPIAVMLDDHAVGRNFVKAMADNIIKYKSGNTSALAEIYAKMKGYVELLRAHIGKENNILFRMADKVLSDEDQQILLNSFGQIEINYELGSNIDSVLFQINNLSLEYNINTIE